MLPDNHLNKLKVQVSDLINLTLISPASVASHVTGEPNDQGGEVVIKLHTGGGWRYLVLQAIFTVKPTSVFFCIARGYYKWATAKTNMPLRLFIYLDGVSSLSVHTIILLDQRFFFHHSTATHFQ